ncbi:uncharacterized protein A4U43_C07F24500 [Asparagus officinalis]|uniref:Uncharacterized protein n=1 Tax=Asparagus officinalis TaxID=4686 RepID=A0A5P1EEQ8_ASPOF|nr:uncharacterized protein A4U43_C07F24500 [Asparagus officinalis]
MSETMPDRNAKASLDAGADLLFRDWSSSSLGDDYSESFGSSFREAPAQKAPPRKKSRGWNKSWSTFFSFLPPYFVFHNRDMVLQESRKLINRNPSEIYLNDAYPCSMF